MNGFGVSSEEEADGVSGGLVYEELIADSAL